MLYLHALASSFTGFGPRTLVLAQEDRRDSILPMYTPADWINPAARPTLSLRPLQRYRTTGSDLLGKMAYLLRSCSLHIVCVSSTVLEANDSDMVYQFDSPKSCFFTASVSLFPGYLKQPQ